MKKRSILFVSSDRYYMYIVTRYIDESESNTAVPGGQKGNGRGKGPALHSEEESEADGKEGKGRTRTSLLSTSNIN